MQSDNTNRMLVDSVHLQFGPHTVLQGSFLTAESGRVTGVLGRNGTGKSCLFKCIVGGLRSQNMFVRFNDEPKTDYAHIGKRVKYLPQNLFVPGNYTLGEAFRLYGVDYDELVRFDPKFHTFQRTMFKELSGGEAQRIKLATELSKKSTGKTIYVLDEPTTGLHFADVHKLVEILKRLSEGGNTVVVIEHNLDVIKTADYIIDIGPEGGDKGGTVVAQGTPEEIAQSPNSYTGKYVKKYLED